MAADPGDRCGPPRVPRPAGRELTDDEALVAADEDHLDFRCSVAVHREQRLLSVTTTVRLHGRRGRLSFLPVRLVHPVAVQAMVAGARRSLHRRSCGLTRP